MKQEVSSVSGVVQYLNKYCTNGMHDGRKNDHAVYIGSPPGRIHGNAPVAFEPRMHDGGLVFRADK